MIWHAMVAVHHGCRTSWLFYERGAEGERGEGRGRGRGWDLPLGRGRRLGEEVNQGAAKEKSYGMGGRVSVAATTVDRITLSL